MIGDYNYLVITSKYMKWVLIRIIVPASELNSHILVVVRQPVVKSSKSSMSKLLLQFLNMLGWHVVPVRYIS